MNSSLPRILFFGTPELARISLEALFHAGFPVVGVVSQPDKPAGRGKEIASSPVALFAKEKNIPLWQPQSLKGESSLIKEWRSLNPDFLVVVAYGHFLPQEILDLPKIAPINLHASLLPKYRGASPILRSILNGEKETGMSVMKIIKKMDAGPVYATEKILIEEKDTTGTLTPKLASLGAKLLVKTLPEIFKKEIEPVAQDETKASFAPSLKKEEGKLNWNDKAETLHNKIRAFDPWPSAFTFFEEKRLKIFSSLVLKESINENPGTVYSISPQGLSVRCAEDALLIKEVQLEGKKRMKAFDFANGVRLKTGVKLL